jgi:hypothetical protein
MTRRYAHFSDTALGVDLEIQRGGAVLTTIAPSLSINRTCLLTVGQLDYESFAEFVLYGPSGTPVANKVSIGVATALAGLDTYVGGDDQGLGYRLGEGAIHHDGGSEASVTAGALGDVIGVRFVPNGEGGGTLTWYRKPLGGVGALLGTVAIPVAMQGVPLYLAASLGSNDDPGDLSLLCRSGLQWYENPVAGQDAGWWEAQALPGALRFASQHFVSAGTDAPPYTRWERGVQDSSIRAERRCFFPIWGVESSAPGGGAEFTVDDDKGRLDAALYGLYRDAAVELRDVPVGGTLASSTLRGRYILDRVDPINRLQRKVVLRGPLAAFEVPMLRLEARPDADPEAAFALYPMMVGPVFNFEPLQIRKASQEYAIDQLGVTGVGKVRTAGDPLDPTIPDYTIGDGGRVLTLADAAKSVVTIDAGATGAEYEPEAPVDALDGIGAPFGDGGSGAIVRWRRERGSIAIDYPAWVSGGKVRFIQDNTRNSWIVARNSDDTADLLLDPAKRYRVTVVISQLTQFPDLTAVPCRLQLCSEENQFAGFAEYAEAGTYSFVMQPISAHPVVVYYRATNVVGGPDVILDSLRFDELPDIADADDTDEIDESVADLALSLESMMRYGIETICGKPPSVWVPSTAAAIDTVTGFRGQGYATREQITLRDFINLLLAPYCASVYETWEGLLAVARLIDPETVEPDHVLTAADILEEGEPVWDSMPGLTLRAGGRHNVRVLTDADLADELTDETWRSRRKLMQRWRIQRSYGGPIAPGLDHSRAADPLDTWLVDPADIQACVDHMGRLARVPRCTWSIRVREPRRWEIGSVLLIPSSRFPEGARRMYLFGGAETDPGKGRILVWGRHPAAPAA